MNGTGRWGLCRFESRARLTLEVHEDEPGRVGLQALQRPARPVQDVGAQLPRRLLGTRLALQGSILGQGKGGEAQRGGAAGAGRVDTGGPGRGLALRCEACAPSLLTCWFHQCAPTKPEKWPNCRVSTSRATPAMPRRAAPRGRRARPAHSLLRLDWFLGLGAWPPKLYPIGPQTHPLSSGHAIRWARRSRLPRPASFPVRTALGVASGFVAY